VVVLVLTCDDHVVVSFTVLVHRVDGLFTDARQVNSRPIIEHLAGDVSAVHDATRCLAEMIE